MKGSDRPTSANPPARQDEAIDYAIGGANALARHGIDLARRADGDLDQAILALEERFAPLACALEGIAAPAGLWDRIDSALNADETARIGTSEQRLTDGEWRDFAPGIAIKTLWDGVTFMLRCAPGAVIPPHPHVAGEHTVVIVGDMIIGESVYGPGDYHFAQADIAHSAITTRTGCVLLLRYQ
jgi:hypothetical protein